MKRTATALVAASFLLAGCAGTPGPGDSGYPFNVMGEYSGSLSADGQGFSATMDMTTAAGGAVSGTFEVTQPIRITGQLEGQLVGDQLALAMRYGNNPMTGCSEGTVTGTVTVGEGGATVAGPVTIDDCGTLLSGNMRMTR